MAIEKTAFSESDLAELHGNLTNRISPEADLIETLSALTFSLIAEPGDQMLGALVRYLGRRVLLSALVDGLNVKEVTTQIGPTAVAELESRFGQIDEVIQDCQQRWLPRLSLKSLRLALIGVEQLDLKLVLPGQIDWPSGLDDLGDSAPRILFASGKIDSLSLLAKSKSIVGSRSPSSYGVKVTERLISEIAPITPATVSGGAIGIDRLVHEESLRHNLRTVAVMAGGLDRRYPKANFELFEKIASQGALVSEMPPGTTPTRWRFLQRNRLIAALTPETVVIEAGIRSGSISTANHALELDRELLAVPGPVFSEYSMGTNRLIAEGKARAWIPGIEKSPNISSNESALATRAADAIRELQLADEAQIQRLAGLTNYELRIALGELRQKQHILMIPSSSGNWHYALKYGG